MFPEDRPWTWPAWLNRLQRTQTLSFAEREALALWMNTPTPTPLQHSDLTDEIKQTLHQLMIPAATVFTYCGYSDLDKHAYACAALLLKEMHVRQTPLWAWDEVIWLEFVGLTIEAFTARHGQFQQEHYLHTIELRPYAMIMAYLLSETPVFERITQCQITRAARRAFGTNAVEIAIHTVQRELKRIGRSTDTKKEGLRTCICRLLLLRRSPRLADITWAVVEETRQSTLPVKSHQWGCVVVSKVLHNLSILPQALDFVPYTQKVQFGIEDSLSPAWLSLLEKWAANTRMEKITLNHHRVLIAKAGRWAAATYPEAGDPAQWTPQTASAFVEAVEQLTIGQWNHPLQNHCGPQLGRPMSDSSKGVLLNVVRRFFANCQDLNFIPRLFTVTEWLKTPPAIRAARVHKPRVIASDRWEKLIQAGLSLTVEDLPAPGKLQNPKKQTSREPYYPLELVQAIAAVWLYSGLRSDEIQRLQVGCIRTPVFGDDYLLDKEGTPQVISILRVPKNKTMGEFEKPVDARVGAMVEQWEKIRPRTRPKVDKKTGKPVHFLFTWRGERIGPTYINKTLIPLLCRKAQIAEYDADGAIKSHCSRSTNATRLYERYMNIYELMKWLGHTSLRSTQHYVDINLKSLCASYRKAVSSAAVARRPNDPLNYESQFDANLLQLWEYVEQAQNADADELESLRPQPRKAIRTPVWSLRNNLLKFQEDAPLDAADREQLIASINLLTRFATQAEE
jgi:integrase